MNQPAPGTRRIRTLGALVAASSALGAFGAVSHAAADPAPLRLPVDGQYWACIALDHVEIGTCIENPLPDLSEAETLEDLIEALLAG